MCDGLGGSTGISGGTEEPKDTIKIESDDSVKSIALVNEIPPKRRHVRRSLESKFTLSRISASPVNEEVTLHPEGDNFLQWVPQQR